MYSEKNFWLKIDELEDADYIIWAQFSYSLKVI